MRHWCLATDSIRVSMMAVPFQATAVNGLTADR
jgi:hypothetical protein